jgi:hypothetical protein
VQLKDLSIYEIRGGLKTMAAAAKHEYNRNRQDMTPEFAASPHNMALSLPDFAKQAGWRPQWKPHIFHMNADVIEKITQSMKDTEVQKQGLRAIMSLIKKEKP